MTSEMEGAGGVVGSTIGPIDCDENSLNNSQLAEWLQDNRQTALLVDRAITPLWYIVGISGNIISAFIWLRSRMRRNNSSAVYLATLSINDTLFLLLHLLQELKYAWSLRIVDYSGICEAFAYIYLVTQYLAPTLVLGFTVERFIAVCYPYQKSLFCTAGRALKVVLCMIGGCLLVGTMQLYLWTFEAAIGECVVREEARGGRHSSLFAIWSWVTEMLLFLVVPLLILLFNILVMREVCRMSNAAVESAMTRGRHSASKSAATNAMLLSVSFYVIFTTLPATVVYVLGNAFPEPDPSPTGCTDVIADASWHQHIVYYTIRKVVDEICMSHYACNFFMFFVTGMEFRLELRRTARRCLRLLPLATAARDHGNGDSEQYATNMSGRQCRGSLRSADESHTLVTRV